jgi:site-specific DNA recombinase
LPQGTGRGLYGYKWDKETKKRIPIEFELKVVEKIFTMIAEGKSLFVAAKELNQQGIPTKGSRPGKLLAWHPLTVKRIVKNQAYTGKTYFGTTHRISKAATTPVPKDQWKLLPEVTPAIIGQELFDRANAELAKPKLRSGRAIQEYLVKGHVFCSKCGRPLVGSWLSKRYRYYQCSGARPTASRGKVCDASYVRADWLEDTTWNKIKDILQNPDLILQQVRREMQTAQEGGNLDAIDTETTGIERRLRNYPGQKRRLLQAFKIDGFEKDDILDELGRLQHDKDSDLKRQAELQQARATLVNLAQAEVQITTFCQNANYNLENCSSENKKLAFDMLDIKVFASSDHLEIKGVIPQEFVTTARTSA